MPSVEVRPGTPADAATVRDLDRRVLAHSGHEAFGEAVRRDLERPAPRGTIVEVRDGHDHVVALGHLLPAAADGNALAEAGAAVEPGAPDSALAAVLDGLVLAARRVTPDGSVLWLLGAAPAADTAATAAGWKPQRALHQMRIALPVPEPVVWPDGVVARPFVQGVDEAAWLAVNNRAFAGHPEQGSWTVETLREREREPWFDPEGIVMAWRGDRLAGSCWTKVHEANEATGGRRLGEIYVIGVDPDFHGGGLGRPLVLAGLEHLAGRGITIGMLYVDAANRAAMRLYESLGFHAFRTDRAYVHGAP